jgi:hypothetical protein
MQMLKLTVAVLTLALAGTASAGGWRSLRIDGSSEASFAESVAAFKEKLPLSRRYAFAWALQDIWVQGIKDAEAAKRDYTANDYFRQVDGLGYDEVVTMVDPTGDTEQLRRKEAYTRLGLEGARVAGAVRPNDSWGSRPAPIGPTGEQLRGSPDSGPVYQHQQRTMGQ